MALPAQLKSARLTDASVGSTIDNGVGELEQALADILGIPIDTPITAALFSVTAGGIITIAQAGFKITGVAGFHDGSNRFPYKNTMAALADTAPQSIPNDTDTVLSFAAESFDTDLLHSNTVDNSRITVNIDGKYLIVCFIEFAENTVGLRLLKPRKNGITTLNSIRKAPIVGDATSLSYVEPIPLVATDYIELMARQTSGDALNVTNKKLSLIYVGE